ncbi:MAG: radical SAM protein [Pseudomonadota bacterium]|nr:radical SAM protein [Pseudomonadota bacterium]
MDWFKFFLKRTKRYAYSFYILNKNKFLGRTFVPPPYRRLFIETVSFCNLECKFCTYPKHLHPRGVMEDELFRQGIDQAAALGIDEIALTPINGEVFMDRNILERWQYIEDSSIKSHVFYTNFIGADETMILALLSMKKCRFIEISLYGHDLESFSKITGRSEIQFNRLIENLRILKRHLDRKRPGLEIVIAFRTYRTFRLNGAASDGLLGIVNRLGAAGVHISVSSTVDNWGGDVTKDDISGIQMNLTEGRHLYRKGPCGLPFDSVQVTASGQVNACACRDPRGTLRLGDLRSEPLADILSPLNKRWLKIVEDHEAGHFNDVCRSCGFYNSIYDERRANAFRQLGIISKEEFMSRAVCKENGQALSL